MSENNHVQLLLVRGLEALLISGSLTEYESYMVSVELEKLEIVSNKRMAQKSSRIPMSMQDKINARKDTARKKIAERHNNGHSTDNQGSAGVDPANDPDNAGQRQGLEEAPPSSSV